MDIRRELEALDIQSSGPSINKIEVLTPHKVSIVLLVQQYLKAKQNATENGQIYPAQSRRKFCMLLLKLIQYPDMSYKDLYNILTSPKYEIDKNHLNGFEKCINDLNTLGVENSFDSFDMQTVMEKMLAENGGVGQFGIVGLYIRRMIIKLDRMSFSEMLSLSKSISLYYEKGLRSLAFSSSAKPTGTNMTTETTMKTSYNDDSNYILDTHTVYKDRNNFSKWSIKQAELFIAQQTALLENNELRALSPIKMQEKLNEIINDNPLLSQAYFLTYMNNLRLRDFFNSLDSLHRSFDRCTVQTFNPPETRGVQYSSLNLAIMHANFNHKEEALKSLGECIMLAQEYGDRHCLELANSWYCILENRRIKPNEKCLPDQFDLAMVQSLSLSIQFVVKVSALYGYKPSLLFELLLKSDELNCRNSLMELFANSLAQKSALWTLYGKSEIASLCAQLLLKLNKSWAFGDVGNSESICQVLCCLALWFSIQGEMTLCGTILHHAKERFPRDVLSRNWMICDCYITINQSIYKCKWQDAMKACCQLYIFDKNAGILQRAAINIAKRNLFTARKILDKLLNNDKNYELDSLTKVRALILLAYSMIIDDNHISSEIVEILNDASTIAKEKYLEYEESIIDMIFAYVLLNMKMPQKSLKTIKSCMEIILTNGGIYDRAKTIFIFVKCLIESTENNNEKIKRLDECMDMINESISYFKKLEAHSKVKDIYIYLSKFYNDVELYKKRNKYAWKFKQYDQEFPTSLEYLNVFF